MHSRQRLLACGSSVLQGVRTRHAPSALRAAASSPCCAAAASYPRSFTTSPRRWREQAVSDATPDASALNQAERSMRRFWKTVSLARFSETAQAKEKAQRSATDGQDDHLVVQLDSRSLKTPSGSPLKLPIDRPLLGAMIAREWDEQDRVLRPHALPLVSMPIPSKCIHADFPESPERPPSPRAR